jgi:hypothetical protein
MREFTHLPADRKDWPEHWLELFEERAAIREFEGNVSREEAERWAETEIHIIYEREAN